MKNIEKKVLAKYFEAILSGKKTFELRLADWDCQEGDVLVLNEIDENGDVTGRTIRKRVGTIVKTKEIDFWTKEEIDKHGYQIISLLDEDTE